MTRLLSPEILDTLPGSDPGAQASRRDLRRINAAMGNRAWWRRTLLAHLQPDDRVLELGAGDDGLHEVAPAGTRWDALDRAPPPRGWSGGRWLQSDLREFAHWSAYTVLVGNLVFHHFGAEELAALGSAARPHLRLVLACEPARHWRARLGLTLLCPLIRAHPITRHDARVSIAAGFAGAELAAALGLTAPAWQAQTTVSLRGAHRLVARRARPSS